MKAIRIAHAEQKNWRRELNTFLIAYRTTPHQTTGAAPAELLFRRQIGTKLPELTSVARADVNEGIRDRDQIRKEIGKQYIDAKRHATETEVVVGDEVLLQQKKHDKLTTNFEHEPYKVVEKLGSQVLIRSPTGVHYKRNVAHTKKYIREPKDKTDDTSQSPDTQPVQTDHAENTAQSEDTPCKTPPTVRRSERQKFAPAKLKDYTEQCVRLLSTF